MVSQNKMINFISSESLENRSGGWSGINYNIYQALKSRATINYIGPVKQPILKSDAYLSKIQKLLALPRSLPFFAPKRLNRIKSVINKSLTDNNHSFYWGQMPWLHCRFKNRYSVYLDAGIRTYHNIFLTEEKIQEKELKRIENLEAIWLSSASNIFWGSNWAKNEAEKTLNINNSNQHIVWLGGNVPIPTEISNPTNLNFTFISLRFKEKGGYIACEAFAQVYKKYPEATLTIIGEKPPENILNQPGIKYAGYLRKNKEEELQTFVQILKNSFCLIHPTTMDTMGAVIIEAGYYGCPTIAPGSFAIPELIKNHETGILLEVPFTIKDYVSAMIGLIENPEAHKKMRGKVREFCTSNFTYEIIGDKIVDAICKK